MQLTVNIGQMERPGPVFSSEQVRVNKKSFKVCTDGDTANTRSVLGSSKEPDQGREQATEVVYEEVEEKSSKGSMLVLIQQDKGSMPVSMQQAEAPCQSQCSKTEVPCQSPSVSYTHLRAHETKANLVCRLLLEKKK